MISENTLKSNFPVYRKVVVHGRNVIEKTIHTLIPESKSNENIIICLRTFFFSYSLEYA